MLLVPRRESLVLAKVDLNTLHSHLFYRNSNDIFQLISFTGQKGISALLTVAYISKSRIYLLGQMMIPVGKFTWTMDNDSLWKFDIPKELGKLLHFKGRKV